MIDTVMTTFHLVFGALWVGAVAFVTLGILPVARDGDLAREPFEHVIDRVLWVSRVSAIVMLLSGGHLMGTGGYFDTGLLLETTRGLAVLAMLGLWLVLIALIEVSTRRITSGIEAGLLREPARDGLTWFAAATLVGVGLFVIGGLLTTGAV